MDQEIYYSNNEMSLIKSNGPFLIQTNTKSQNPMILKEFKEIKSPTFVGEKTFFGDYKIVGDNLR